ncbi:hypothetical protein [Sphingomonas sp. GM_Shp_1]|uniref:hypothetical protein n=1 Tax=Sphingomonas sp. GM_Shp_1 TaxID=2937381 RepID=UPI00226BBB5C|nr:hypothetical protein [Sphingomonas sp. GM_Shp_1]
MLPLRGGPFRGEADGGVRHGPALHLFLLPDAASTHHQRRSNPDQYGVNVACLKGVPPFDFAEVPVNDGVNHPSDTHQPSRLAGVLRFVPDEPA